MSDHEGRVRSMIRAIKLRSFIKLIREPEPVVDHLLARALGEETRNFTGDLEQARYWVGKLAPDLIIEEPILLHEKLYGIRARLEDQPYPVWLAAEHPAIPTCFAGLNRYIEVAIALTDLNNPRSVLTGRFDPAKFVILRDGEGTLSG